MCQINNNDPFQNDNEDDDDLYFDVDINWKYDNAINDSDKDKNI